MDQRDYSVDIPVDPPEGLIPYLKEKGFFKKHLIRYKAARVLNPLSEEWEPMVELKCSGCGGVMYAPKVHAGICHNSGAAAPFGYYDPVSKKDVISGDTELCPMCGCKARVYHTGQFRYGVTLEEKWPMTITRVEDKLVMIGWYVEQRVNHECEEWISARHYEAYVVEKKKVVRLMGHIRCLSTVSFFTGWEQRKTCLDNWGPASLVYPWKKDILIGSTAENSKLDIYMKRADTPYPVTYLRLWQKHRNIENLVMQGCGNLVGKLIENGSHRYSYQRSKGVPKIEQINWKERRPAKMLGLTGEEFRLCRMMQWTPEILAFYLDCKNKGAKLKLPEDLVDCINTGRLYWCSKILAEKEIPLMRAVRYLKKQNEKDIRADASILDDYWRAARGEGYNLKDDHVRFPKDLMKEHDRVIKERDNRLEAERKKEQAAKYEKWRVDFAKRLKELERFQWTDNGILIRPAATPKELDAEGKALSHCVAGYKDTHAGGRKAIFFIRKTAEPDKPWFTLELNMETFEVCQNRGKANCARTEAVTAFEKAWLEHIKPLKPVKKKEKRGKAA